MPPRTSSKKKVASKKKAARTTPTDPTSQVRHRDDINPEHYEAPTSGPLSGTQAVDVIEAYFAKDAHLSQAIKYLCRAGKKPDSSYTKDCSKAAWWVVRAVIFHGGFTHLRGIKDLLQKSGVKFDD